MSLHERVAEALGWTVAETQRWSFQALRELVRPIDPHLAAELTDEIRSGRYIVGSKRQAR